MWMPTRVRLAVLLAGGAGLLMAGSFAAQQSSALRLQPNTPENPPRTTQIGINLFGLAPHNHQQVFTNLIAQSEWFSSYGQQWSPLPEEQIDAGGWVKYLSPGQTAPRPLILPPAPARPVTVRCTFEGRGRLAAGGRARSRSSDTNSLLLDMESGPSDAGAWIELVQTDPADPLRSIDCRQEGRPQAERFHPELLSFLDDFGVIRFLDWQRVNDNAPVDWSSRTLPHSSTQAGAAGVSIEDMIDLANLAEADPWFIMPYRADETYIRNFAALVHARLEPGRTVYVELGNEVWNDIFAAAQQAEGEGMASGLGKGDRMRARMLRYAQKHVEAMRIWTEVFADQPERLVRVCASQHANPDMARLILTYGDTLDWTDALATAPYVWLDLDGYGAADVDRVFAALPAAIEYTIALAEENRATAASFGLRYIAYEGGQHLVTDDLALARAVQRDPRMGEAYTRYLTQWQARIGDTLNLYASTAPIAHYGSWGLREYAGQPLDDAPKLRAVREFAGAAK